MPQFHCYNICFAVNNGFRSTVLMNPHRNVTRRDINAAALNLGLPPFTTYSPISLVSVSYLGLMTKEEYEA